MNIQVGDVLQMKKTHPCGGREWLVLRVGMDFPSPLPNLRARSDDLAQQGGKKCEKSPAPGAGATMIKA